MAKGKKKSKKSSNAYIAEHGLNKKVDDAGTPATSHLIGREVSVITRDGDRPSETVIYATLQAADENGIRIEREWRGNTELLALPHSAYVLLESKLPAGVEGIGKGENFDKVPACDSRNHEWAEEHVGETCAVTYNDGGRRVALKANNRVLTIDETGVCAIYASHGSEKIVFVPLASGPILGVRVVTEEDDEE